MRPKIIFWLLVIAECFLLGLMISPGVEMSKGLTRAQREYRQSPNEETKRNLEDELARRRLKRAWLGSGAAGLLACMIVYGWNKRAQI